MSRRNKNHCKPVHPLWKRIDNRGVSGTYARDGWTICYTVGWKITRPDGFEYAYRPEQMETAIRFAEKRMKTQQISNL